MPRLGKNQVQTRKKESGTRSASVGLRIRVGCAPPTLRFAPLTPRKTAQERERPIGRRQAVKRRRPGRAVRTGRPGRRAGNRRQAGLGRPASGRSASDRELNRRSLRNLVYWASCRSETISARSIRSTGRLSRIASASAAPADVARHAAGDMARLPTNSATAVGASSASRPSRGETRAELPPRSRLSGSAIGSGSSASF